MAEQRLTFMSDPGHGWLVVPIADVKASGAVISPYSYVRGELAYLEEDLDAGSYLRAIGHTGPLTNVREIHGSPRSFASYTDPNWKDT
jgi:hypothetical protein